MGFLFLLVMVGGGISLYLAYSIYVNTEAIKRERERLDLVEQMHDTVHHFVSDLQWAVIKGINFPSAERRAYMEKFSYLLELYHRSGAGEKEIEEKIPYIAADLASLSDKLANQRQNFPQLLRPRLSPQDLAPLSEAIGTINSIIQRLSAAHRASLEQKVLENRLRIELIVGVYAGFVILGTLLILGSSLLFHRTISQPLRYLAVRASEIAKGNFDEKVQVTSRDEIGRLSHAFNVMLGDIKKLQESSKQMAALEERERVAQELHDSVAQDLGLLHLQLIDVERGLSSKKFAETMGMLREMRQIADRAYEDVRQSIFGLRTMVSKNLGLIPTLAEYLHEFSETRKVPINLRVHGPDSVSLPRHVEIQLIRIIHEALINVFKHAQATTGSVKFERDGSFTKVIIEDDGKGFVVGQPKENGFHFGLETMRERAKAVGGRLTIDSTPGRGTRVIVHLPLGERTYEAHSGPAGR